MTLDLTGSLPLALGGNTFGWTSDEEESFAVLDAFLAAGGRHIDTADVYSAWAPGNDGGVSERVIGRWLADRGTRDQVVLATKVGALESRKGLARENVEAALEESLERLGTDHVDLYYAHFDDDSQSPAELARTFDALVRAGKVREIGLSNLSPARQLAYIEAAQAEGLTLPSAIQVQYSLAHRADVESGYGQIARDHDLALLSYFSLAAGLLTGKYRGPEDLSGAARSGQLEGYATTEGFALVDTLVTVAERHEVEPTSAALAWLRAKGVSAPVASARTTEQLPALIDGVRLELDEKDVAELDAASAPFTS
ncbi:alcohol dehydrogenase [Brachybacterium endophyticum]|uniref:Alcohol dehydrogenase n=1 Tax=Brachybacterium endophyticum TaxID=2182385 RepID=A0A2U2RLX0_9MICO|nr:aldo/keto reductase [Brachybacterium endophyticum]PWH06869.1 alcohol dehydrogenase [Brachybacterium endophyticum]